MSTPVKREDIRKGDRIRSTFTEEFTAKSDTVAHETGFTYELIERPVVLPNVPGVYTDKDGDAWRLDEDGLWRITDCNDDNIHLYAPFTLLRPVAEVAAEVLGAVLHDYTTATSFTNLHEVTHDLAAKYGATL